jgi:opacity protein-like surface antigen
MKSGLILIVCILSFRSGISQDSTAAKGPLMFSMGLNANYGFVLAHSSKVEKTSHAYPIGFTASFNWQRTGRDDFDLYKCLPRHVLQIAYYNLDNSALGKGVNISYAIEPHFMVNRNVSVYPKFAAGLGLLSNPHDSINNPNNKAYSLPVNVYLALGVGVRYQFSKHWAVNVTTEFQHISNGGLYKPNVGMNYPTLGAGLEFSPRGLELKKHQSYGAGEKIRSSPTAGKPVASTAGLPLQKFTRISTWRSTTQPVEFLQAEQGPACWQAMNFYWENSFSASKLEST